MAYPFTKPANRDEWLQYKKDVLIKYASGETLTLEETAAAIWDPDKTDKPMTAMGVYKIEQRALKKLKGILSQLGIKSLSDAIASRAEVPEYTDYAEADA